MIKRNHFQIGELGHIKVVTGTVNILREFSRDALSIFKPNICLLDSFNEMVDCKAFINKQNIISMQVPSLKYYIIMTYHEIDENTIETQAGHKISGLTYQKYHFKLPLKM